MLSSNPFLPLATDELISSSGHVRPVEVYYAWAKVEQLVDDWSVTRSVVVKDDEGSVCYLLIYGRIAARIDNKKQALVHRSMEQQFLTLCKQAGIEATMVMGTRKQFVEIIHSYPGETKRLSQVGLL